MKKYLLTFLILLLNFNSFNLKAIASNDKFFAPIGGTPEDTLEEFDELSVKVNSCFGFNCSFFNFSKKQTSKELEQQRQNELFKDDLVKYDDTDGFFKIDSKEQTPIELGDGLYKVAPEISEQAWLARQPIENDRINRILKNKSKKRVNVTQEKSQNTRVYDAPILHQLDNIKDSLNQSLSYFDIESMAYLIKFHNHLTKNDIENLEYYISKYINRFSDDREENDGKISKELEKKLRDSGQESEIENVKLISYQFETFDRFFDKVRMDSSILKYRFGINESEFEEIRFIQKFTDFIKKEGPEFYQKFKEYDGYYHLLKR